MSMVPSPQQIGMNEMLIRMGAAGLGASAEGGLQALGAIGDTYGQIQDANRATGLAAYQAQMEAMADGSTAKANSEEHGACRSDRRNPLRYAEGTQQHSKAPKRHWMVRQYSRKSCDDAIGNERAATRLCLKKLKVDDAMLRVAQTKGAISNKEMELFLDPAPKDTQDERRLDRSGSEQRMVVLQNVDNAWQQANRCRTRHRQHKSTSSHSNWWCPTHDDADAIVNKYLLRQEQAWLQMDQLMTDWLVQNQDKQGNTADATHRSDHTNNSSSHNSSRAQTVLSLTA